MSDPARSASGRRSAARNPQALRAHWPWALAASVWAVLVAKAARELHGGNDFTILHAAAARVLAGETLYGPGDAYMYPPPCAVLLAPLALLPATAAGVLWALGKAALLHAAAAIFLARARLAPWTRRALIALSPLLVYRFAESDLATGNTNIYLLAGIAGAIPLIERGASLRGGALLALVSTVKLAPLYIAGGLVAARRQRAAWAQCACAALIQLAASAALPGGVAAAWRGFLANSEAVRGAPAAREDDPARGYLPGQSLRPFIHRYLTDSDATAHDGERVTLNVASLSAAQAEWIYRACAVLMGFGALLAARGRDLRWTIAWTLAAMLLISPYSRKAHFVLLLPALLLVVESILAARGTRRAALAWLVLSIALAQLTAPALVGRAAASWLLGAGVVLLSAVAILPAMWMIRGEHDRR